MKSNDEIDHKLKKFQLQFVFNAYKKQMKIFQINNHTNINNLYAENTF